MALLVHHSGRSRGPDPHRNRPAGAAHAAARHRGHRRRSRAGGVRRLPGAGVADELTRLLRRAGPAACGERRTEVRWPGSAWLIPATALCPCDRMDACADRKPERSASPRGAGPRGRPFGRNPSPARRMPTVTAPQAAGSRQARPPSDNSTTGRQLDPGRRLDSRSDPRCARRCRGCGGRSCSPQPPAGRTCGRPRAPSSG